jgi:NDP-sugar pyrophosphorylase family protein
MTQLTAKMGGQAWTGVILAGGLGTRLFPLTQDIPKPLVQVANKAMLDYAIDHLRYAGVTEIIIVLKHFAEKIRDHMQSEWYGNPKKLGDLNIQIPEVDSKDTADALRKVADLVTQDNIVVSMGDIVTNLPLKRFLDFHLEKKGFATISMKAIDEPTQYGVVMLDNDSKIHLFLEKPKPQELYVSSMIDTGGAYRHTNLINTGIYAFKKDILPLLETENVLMDFGKQVFPWLLDNKYDIYGFVENYYWMDVGQPRPYLWANWDLLRKYSWPITPNGQEHDGAWYDEFPKHGPNCKFGKPIGIGKNVVLGHDVNIDSLSVVGDNVMIDDGSWIERSVIWQNAKIGKNVHVTETIICDGATIGDGATLLECVVGPGSVIAPSTSRKYESKIVRGQNDDAAPIDAE